MSSAVGTQDHGTSYLGCAKNADLIFEFQIISQYSDVELDSKVQLYSHVKFKEDTEKWFVMNIFRDNSNLN